MYEVEIKANISDRDRLISLLQKHEIELEGSIVYEDVYLKPDNKFIEDERELRVRRKTNESSGIINSILTYKDKPFDEKSKSKPEWETQIDDFDNCIHIFKKLGLTEDIRFEKKCENYTVQFKNQRIELTLTSLLELYSDFIEVECQSTEIENVEKLFRILKEFLSTVGIGENNYTTEYYTDAVRKRRKNSA